MAAPRMQLALVAACAIGVATAQSRLTFVSTRRIRNSRARNILRWEIARLVARSWHFHVVTMVLAQVSAVPLGLRAEWTPGKCVEFNDAIDRACVQ